MTRDISTTEALMTDPTAPEGVAYWQERHDYESVAERLRQAHPPHHDVEGCSLCQRIRLLTSNDA